MRRPNPKPRANPATVMAFSSEKMNGESQSPVVDTASRCRATSASTATRLRTSP